MGLENPTERNQLLLHTKSECDSVSVRINIYAYQGVKKKKKKVQACCYSAHCKWKHLSVTYHLSKSRLQITF